MSDMVIETTVCHGCYAVLDAADNYCRHCGTSTAERTGLSDGKSSAASFDAKHSFAPRIQQAKWSESPWIILPLLFLILGPFALPLLWRSSHFTLVWKSVLTIIMVGLTVFMLWSIWCLLHQTLVQLRELDQLRGF
jgi:ribosomal protein L40E